VSERVLPSGGGAHGAGAGEGKGVAAGPRRQRLQKPVPASEKMGGYLLDGDWKVTFMLED